MNELKVQLDASVYVAAALQEVILDVPNPHVTRRSELQSKLDSTQAKAAKLQAENDKLHAEIDDVKQQLVAAQARAHALEATQADRAKELQTCKLELSNQRWVVRHATIRSTPRFTCISVPTSAPPPLTKLQA